MMDFGYLGSSSNLSPLAPPFTLDYSIPKPNIETHIHFSDPPPDVSFSSDLPSWQYSLSSSFNPNFHSNSNVDLVVDSIRTTYLTSDNCYRYFGVPSVSSPSTQIPPLNSDISTTPGASAFRQYSCDLPTIHVESKTYCPSFVSPVVDDDDVPLLVLHEPNRGISSTSQIAPLNGSSQVDYHQSLSGLTYQPQWGSCWDRIDGLGDGEMGKQEGYYGCFYSTQTDGVGSYAYKSYLEQGASTAEGFGVRKEASAVPHQICLNLLGGESQIVSPMTCELNNKPLSMQGSSMGPYDPARTLGISSFPEYHTNVPPVEAATTFPNHQKLYSSQDQSFQLLNAGNIKSVTIKRPSPSLVIRPPSVSTNLHLDNKAPLCDSSSSNIKGELPNKPLAEDHKDDLLKAGMRFQLHDMDAPPYSFTSTFDIAKEVASVEVPIDSLDRNYPALDSPCWKGVSSFTFSPSENRVAVISEHLVKKPESSSGLKLQQSQFFTPCGEDNVKFSIQKVHENIVYQENGYVELGSLLCPDKLRNASSPVKVDNPTLDDGVNVGSGKVDPFSSNIDKLTKEFDEPNDSKGCPELKPSQLKQPCSEEDLELGFGVAEAGFNCDDTFSKFNVQKLVDTIHNLSKLLLSQFSDGASALLEVDHKALKLAMKNLEACVSKKIIPILSQESNLHESVISGRPPVRNEASSHHGFDYHCPKQGTKDSELSEKEVKKFTDLFSARVDEDFVKDNKVTQAIKKILEDSLSAEEEMQAETLLYKKLWLEAEAALCSISFRARYERLKTEVDKYKSPRTIEVAEPVKSFEKLYSEVFHDPSSCKKRNPIIESFKILDKSTKHHSASSKSLDEVEATLRARLHILNNRTPNQESIYAGEQTDEESDAAFADAAETIKTVEKLLSSKDAEDCAMTNPTQKVPPRDSPSSASGKTGDNFEASVVAGFQILKDRDLKAISEESGSQSEQVINSDFSGVRNPWGVSAVIYDDEIDDRVISQYCKVSEPEQTKDFRVCAYDDLASQHGGNKKLGTQLSSGWCDDSLSDWEDVLKDESVHPK